MVFYITSDLFMISSNALYFHDSIVVPSNNSLNVLINKSNKKHHFCVFSRYIEVFRSSSKELFAAVPQHPRQPPPSHHNIGGSFRGSMNQFQQSCYTRDDYFGVPRGARRGVPSFTGNARGRGQIYFYNEFFQFN